MLPLKVSLANQKCDCACHDKHSYFRHQKECCVICDICKFRIKTDCHSLHLICHEEQKNLEEEK